MIGKYISTSGRLFFKSSKYLSTRHPIAITILSFLFSVTSNIVSIASFLALSIKPQVLTTIMFASFKLFVISRSYFLATPKNNSESIKFLAQPREIIPSFILLKSFIYNYIYII